MWQRLQPYVMEAAALCDGGFNPMWRRLQPYEMEAAALRGAGCNHMWRRLQPYLSVLPRGSSGWSAFGLDREATNSPTCG